MKINYVLTIVLSIALLSFSTFAHEPLKSIERSATHFSGLDTAAGRSVLAYHEALSNGQADDVMSALTSEVIILEGSRIERSAEEYRQHHLHADMRFSAAVKPQQLNIMFAFMGIRRSQLPEATTLGTYKGKQIDKQGNETLVLNLINGHWKISHIHWSH